MLTFAISHLYKKNFEQQGSPPKLKVPKDFSLAASD